MTPRPLMPDDTRGSGRADCVAAACLREAVKTNPPFWRGRSSGWAQDEQSRIMRRLSELSGASRPWYGNDIVHFYINRDASGQARIWCETEVDAFDHIIAETDAQTFEAMARIADAWAADRSPELAEAA